jgi:REP element-mobilizing transposase RayT
MNRGRRGEAVFSEARDYTGFIQLIKETVEMWKVRVVAYCLLPNHYHLLIQTPEGNLSRCMRHLNGVYTQRFNRSYHCDGPLFRGRYKSILVDADTYLLELVRYIHRNPVEAAMVDELQKYPWSSHKGYLSASGKWNWLDTGFILSLFSKERKESIKRYKKFVSVETPEQISAILARHKWPSMLGSETFVSRMKEKFFHSKQHEEVPASRSLAPEVEEIKEAVCRVYSVENDTLLSSRRGVFNEPRNVAMYLTRRLRGERLEDIGRGFNISKYSSVSSAIEKIRKEILTNATLKRRISKLEALLTNSQKQT